MVTDCSFGCSNLFGSLGVWEFRSLDDSLFALLLGFLEPERMQRTPKSILKVELLNVFHSHFLQTILPHGALVVLGLSGRRTDGAADERVPRWGFLIQGADLISQALKETQQEESAIVAAPRELSRTGSRGNDVALGLQEQ